MQIIGGVIRGRPILELRLKVFQMHFIRRLWTRGGPIEKDGWVPGYTPPTINNCCSLCFRVRSPVKPKRRRGEEGGEERPGGRRTALAKFIPPRSRVYRRPVDRLTRPISQADGLIGVFPAVYGVYLIRVKAMTAYNKNATVLTALSFAS